MESYISKWSDQVDFSLAPSERLHDIFSKLRSGRELLKEAQDNKDCLTRACKNWKQDIDGIQEPVFEAQIKLAKQLRRPDGKNYPLVLHLRDKESMNTDVQRDALKLMTEAGIPAGYPIHFHFWSGDRVQYETWTSHFPGTLFGYNSSFFKRSLTEGQLELLQTVPLDSVTVESDAPHHGTEGTSQALGTSAGLVFAIKKFKELGKRRAEERAIALKSMENVIRFYRPDLSIVALPVPSLSVHSTRATQVQTASKEKETSASRPAETNSTQTMYELAAVCDAGRPGLHVRCASIYPVGSQYHDGAILARDWNQATRSIADAKTSATARFSLRRSSFFAAGAEDSYVIKRKR